MNIYPDKVEPNDKPLFQVPMQRTVTVDGGVACFFADRIECDFSHGQTNTFAVYRRSPSVFLAVDIPKRVFVVCIDRFSIDLDVNMQSLEIIRGQIVQWMRK